MIAKSIERYFFKKKLKRLMSIGVDNPQFFYNSTIGSALVFLKEFNCLADEGFNNIVEIAPGCFSVAALSIKASSLDSKLKYHFVESDNESSFILKTYHKKIKINSIHIDKCLMSFFENSKLNNSILLFDHSIEDLLISIIAIKIGIDCSCWKSILCQLYSRRYIPDILYIDNFVSNLLYRINNYAKKHNSCFLIHHYSKILYEYDFMKYLDNAVHDSLRNNKNLYSRTISSNYNNAIESFFLGGI